MKKIYLTFLAGLLGIAAAQAAAGVSNIVAGAASVTADTNGVVTWPAHPVVKNLDVQTNLLVTGTVTANGAILYGNSAHTNAVYIGPSGEVLSNAVGVVTIAGGTVSIGNRLNLGGTNYTIQQTNTTATNYFAGKVGLGTPVPLCQLEMLDATNSSSTPILLQMWSRPFQPSTCYYSSVGFAVSNPDPWGGINTRLDLKLLAGSHSSATVPEITVATFYSNGHIGFGVTNPGTNFVVKGEGWFTSLYITNDVSALTFTDRSDSPADLAEAARMIASCAVADGKVDHSKLDPGLWGKSALYIDTGLKTTNVVEAIIDTTGKVLQPKLTNTTVIYATTVVPDQSKRNLSMLVSAQALVIQDLIRRIEKLEGK